MSYFKSKYVLILFPFFMLLSQDDLDLDLNENEANQSCEFEIVPSKLDSVKYDGQNLQNDIGRWYAIGYTDYYKKYSAFTGEKQKQYIEKCLEYFWRVVANDPTGTVKNRRGASYSLKAAEKMAKLYRFKNDLEMLQVVLKKGFELGPTSDDLHYSAGIFFVGAAKPRCAIDHLEKYVMYAPKKPRYNATKADMLKIAAFQYAKLEDFEKALETAEKSLKFDEDDELRSTMATWYGDPEELFKALKSEWEKDKSNLQNLAKAAGAAMRADEYSFAIESYKTLLKSQSDNMMYRQNIVKAAYKNENYRVIANYASSLQDETSRRYLVEAYVKLGQFGKAFSYAQKIQRSNRSQGHYFKGYVYEKTARAAQENGIKDYEFRLIYRLAYIEYKMGGASGKSRASVIKAYIIRKSDWFTTYSQRIKPKAGKFSSWIKWQKAYNGQYFAPES